LYRKEILATINLAHYFQSAFTAEQVYRYLRVKMCRKEFDRIIRELNNRNLVFKLGDALFTRDLEAAYQQKKQQSQHLFKQHRFYLKVISTTPWVKYAALTGANAFQSCSDRDDIDLFLVTAQNRLWLCYVTLVMVSKLLCKRNILCINYLVDEKNLHIPQQDYYTAVQIMQMIPLFKNEFGKKIIDSNPWIFKYLPNADSELPVDRFYLLRNGQYASNGSVQRGDTLSRLNRKIYEKYSQRLARKYPREFGKGIRLGEGLAKLNRIDHRDIYEEIYRKIYRDINTTLQL
jgi:hypothetical protein